MSSKAIAALVACLLLFGIASAQEYSIRANRGLNLRTAPSRNADIADTVRSGTILQVVGTFNRWLKIDRYGRQVWLADWVDFSRIDSIAPPASPALPAPSGPVDNCCYVDRQCHSDLDWMGGWHAFQNGQCAAPAQPQPATPAQPVASAPANVDNCCYVDRQCHSDLDWMGGWHAFRAGQCAAPGQPHRATPSGSMPRIEGSDIFVQHIITSLNWLKRLSPAWYNYVVNGMDLIVEVPTSPRGTMEFHNHYDFYTKSCSASVSIRERRVEVQTCWMEWTMLGTGPPEFDQPDTVGMLAHEACHVHTREAGTHFPSQEREEEECNKYYIGAYLPLQYEFHKDLDPSRGTSNWWDVFREAQLSRVRSLCADKSAGYGFRPELFCESLRVVQGL